MTIEIHQPELVALIQERMESGRFGSVEEVLLDALKPSQEPDMHLEQKDVKPGRVPDGRVLPSCLPNLHSGASTWSFLARTTLCDR